MKKKLLLLVPLFGVSFFGVGTMVRAWVPWPHELGLRNKLEYFARHKDEFDAVYIGSSRVIRGLDNVLVDRLLAEEGIEMRSFNLGVGGMRTLEQDLVLHEVVALRPKKLRWIFLEGGPWDPEFKNPDNTYSWRTIAWHTPGQTMKVLRSFRGYEAPWREKLRLLGVHLHLMLWKLSSYGRGSDVVHDVLGTGPVERGQAEVFENLAAGGGYQSMEDSSGLERSPECEEWDEDPTPYLELVGSIPGENARAVDLDALDTRAVEAQYEAARGLGAELIYFVMPGIEGNPQRLRLHEAGIIPVLFDFNRPDAYPELFRRDHRWDRGHLNRRGGRELSRLMAEAITEHVRTVQ